MWRYMLGLLLGMHTLYAVIPEKVIICGVCKNIEKAIPNTIASVERLGQEFLDYRVIFYENNSEDYTKLLLHRWAAANPKVFFLSETLSFKDLDSDCNMGVSNRTELIARARNRVLDIAMRNYYDEYKYIIWADLDFLDPWDVEGIVDTILHPEEEWDAVFANGAYDQFAYRDSKYPIGFELIGERYWWHLDEMRKDFYILPDDPWRPVYSAFGGLAIYKREALRGCHYSGVVTKDLEILVEKWLQEVGKKEYVPLLKYYDELLQIAPVFSLTTNTLQERSNYPEYIGLRLFNRFGDGKVIWFSCTNGATLPWTCEHITLHASMILKGRDKLFLNPRLISRHP